MRHLLSPAFRRIQRAAEQNTKISTTSESQQQNDPFSNDASACSVVCTSNRMSFALPSVPSSSLLLEELLKLWPSETGDTIESVNCTGDSRQRRSVAILLDSSAWCQDLPASQDPSSPPADSYPGRDPAQLSTPVNKARTPVPSLTFSQESAYSRFSQEDHSSATSIMSPLDLGARRSVPQSPCPVKTTAIRQGDNEMVDPYYKPPQTRGTRNAVLAYDDATPFEVSYINPWTHGCVSAVDPKVQPRNIASGPQETSYIEWDDEEDEHKLRIPTALSRIRKSLADLRAADRFISGANSGRKASTKSQDSVKDTVASIPRPVTAAGSVSNVKDRSPTNFTYAAPYQSLYLEKSLPPLPHEQIMTTSTEAAWERSPKRRSTESMAKKCSRSLASSANSTSGHMRTIHSELESAGPTSPVAFHHSFTSYDQSPKSASSPNLTRMESFDGPYLKTDKTDEKPSITLMDKWLNGPLGARNEK